MVVIFGKVVDSSSCLIPFTPASPLPLLSASRNQDGQASRKHPQPIHEPVGFSLLVYSCSASPIMSDSEPMSSIHSEPVVYNVCEAPVIVRLTLLLGL